MAKRFGVILVRQSLWAAICALWLVTAQAHATVVLGSHDWDTGDEGWTNPGGEGWVHVSNPNPGGNPNGYLRVLMDSVVFDEYETLVSVSASSLFAGTWDDSMSIQFDFWAQNSAPEEIRVEWGASGGSGTAWGNTVFDINDDSMGLGTWTSLASDSFMDYLDWDIQGTGNQSDFLSDLASIDWIGVYIFRGDTDEDIYGLDNFELTVPEPAEVLLLCAALVATGLAYRKRREWQRA